MDAEKLYRKFFNADLVLQDISMIELPDDRTILRALAERCRTDSRVAVLAGRQMEVKRLSELATQLDRRARETRSRERE
jgi:hypothetical protein